MYIPVSYQQGIHPQYDRRSNELPSRYGPLGGQGARGTGGGGGTQVLNGCPLAGQIGGGKQQNLGLWGNQLLFRQVGTILKNRLHS